MGAYEIGEDERRADEMGSRQSWMTQLVRFALGQFEPSPNLVCTYLSFWLGKNPAYLTSVQKYYN